MIEAQLNAGVAFLDEKLGTDWVYETQTYDLNLHSPYNCVLGQLFGDFNVGREKLGLNLDDTVRYGFYLPCYDFPYNESEYTERISEEATQDWVDKIEHLKEVRRHTCSTT